MEKWNLYDKDRKKLERIVCRGDRLNDGEYHLVVNVWIKNKHNEFLISQRASHRSHPLMWECTGGSAIKDDESVDAAIREVKEELNIDLKKEDGVFIGSTLRYYPNNSDILDVWLFHADVPIENIKIQEEEVNDVMWASADKIRKLYIKGKFETNAFFEDILNF